MPSLPGLISRWAETNKLRAIYCLLKRQCYTSCFAEHRKASCSAFFIIQMLFSNLSLRKLPNCVLPLAGCVLDVITSQSRYPEISSVLRMKSKHILYHQSIVDRCFSHAADCTDTLTDTDKSMIVIISEELALRMLTWGMLAVCTCSIYKYRALPRKSYWQRNRFYVHHVDGSIEYSGLDCFRNGILTNV